MLGTTSFGSQELKLLVLPPSHPQEVPEDWFCRALGSFGQALTCRIGKLEKSQHTTLCDWRQVPAYRACSAARFLTSQAWFIQLPESTNHSGSLACALGGRAKHKSSASAECAPQSWPTCLWAMAWSGWPRLEPAKIPTKILSDTQSSLCPPPGFSANCLVTTSSLLLGQCAPTSV